MAAVSPLSLKTCLQVLSTSLSLLSVPVLSAAIPESVDVAIIGAGLSGLSAAKNLLAAGKSVVILEARNRVGGKVLNRPLKNGGVTEVGAEFVGPTQDNVLNLIAELGLTTFPTYNEGNNVLYRNNNRKTYETGGLTGDVPPVDLLAIGQAAIAQARLDALAAEIDVNAPWTHPSAKEWDSITFATWLKIWAFLPDTTFLFQTVSKAIFSANPEEVSLFYVIQYIASAGNAANKGTVERLTGTAEGAQQQRVEGGTGLIPERLAAKIGLDHIVFNAAVTSVTKTATGYSVVSKAGTVQAKKVVLALSPPLVNKIAFSPALPAARQQLNKLTKMGAIGKGIAVYDTPFWRADGLNAQALSDKGVARSTFDNSPANPTYGAVMGFILADEMRAYDGKSEAEIKTAVTADYVRYFGAKAASPTDFIVQRWDLEEFSLGGPVAIAPPKVLQQYGPALRAPVDGIHFAGTETAVYWIGYMSGAIEAGYRVAKEILAS